MRNFLVFVFLVTITNPYSGRGIDWGENESQLYEYETDKRIIVVEPEKDDTTQDKRLEQKIKSILNRTYSPYVFDHTGRLLTE